MAIAQQRKRLTSSSLHFPNDLKTLAGKNDSDSGTKLKNHQEAAGDLLFDPKDAEGGTTHSDKPVKVSAAVDDEDLDFENIEDAMPSDEEASLYAADEGMVDSILDQDDADEDLDIEEESDEGQDDGAVEEVEADLEDFGGDMGVDDESFADADQEVEAENLCGEDGVPLVDVDQTEDAVSDTDDLGFVGIGASLHCIKANRIIATMTKAQAIKADKADFYQGDEFPQVVAAEVQTKGLRKGLLAAGFVLAKVDVESNKAVQAAVKKELDASKKQLTASTGKDQEAFQQCMAIAAVGINRNFFKNTKNTLKAALEEELTNAGIRGGAKMVRAMFAEYGIEYARSIIATANKLVAMPEETRNQFAEALDMTDVGDDEAEDDQQDEDFDPDSEDDSQDLPVSVSAAVRKPLHSTRVVASSRTQKSTTQEILSGAKPLPFLGL